MLSISVVFLHVFCSNIQAFVTFKTFEKSTYNQELLPFDAFEWALVSSAKAGKSNQMNMNTEKIAVAHNAQDDI